MKKKILYVKKEQFLEWFLSDEVGKDVATEMLEENQKVTAQDLLDGVGFLPFNLILNPERISDRDRKAVDKEDATLEEDILVHYELRFFPLKVKD